MKIKFKLLLIFLLITIIPLILMSIVSIYNSREALKASIGTNFLNLAKERAHFIDNLIRERTDETENLAHIQELKNAVMQSNLSYINKSDHEINNIINQIDNEWINSKGTSEITNQILNNDLSLILQKHQNRKQDKIGEILVTDVRGVTVAMTKILSDYYQADEGWWKTSYDKGRGKVFIDYRGYDSSVGALVLGIAVPVKDKGEVVGILKINYKIKEMMHMESIVQIGNPFERFILSSRGDIIYYSGMFEKKEASETEKAQVKNKEAGWFEEIFNDRKTIEAFSIISTKIYSRVPAPGAREGISGERWEPSRWYIFLETDRGVAFVPIGKLRNIFIGAGFLAAVFVSLLAFFIARKISNPIEKLRQGADIIGKGDLKHRVEIKAGGEIGELATSFNQMSEKRQQVEKLLQDSEMRLKKAQEIGRVGHWDLDLITNKLKWSDEIYRIFDIDPGESGADNKAFLDKVHPEDRGYVNEAYADSEKNKEPYDIIYRLLMKDGSIKHVNERCTTDYGKDGDPLRSLGTVQDITEQKRIEEEYLKIAKLESLGIFAGGIAHDFNNLLTAIVGNISLAKIELDPKGRIFKILNESEKASLRAKALTDQLLTFSKGGAPIKKTVSLRELIRDWVQFALMGSNVRTDFIVSDQLWNVEVDEGQMQQVFHNLVINACQAMPEGGVLKVQAENVILEKNIGFPLERGRYVKISMKDQGIGILVEQFPKIFDPFFTTKQKGSGLGLSTTYSIMKRHQGHIEVESEAGVGTTFHLYLPASDKEIAADRDQNTGLIGGEGRILIMDDEEVIRDFAATALKHFGYEVELARDGSEAIDLYKRGKELGQPYGVVIMDLTIPGGMGGKEAIKEILKIDPDAKVIVSSGYSNDPIMADYKNHGFKGILTKPYRSSDLGEIIKRVIKNSDE